jgi:hypothetical protein
MPHDLNPQILHSLVFVIPFYWQHSSFITVANQQAQGKEYVPAELL